MRKFFCMAGLGIFLFPYLALASPVSLAVPFTSQAPFGVWKQPWEDFCEEASVVMAAHFVWGMPLTPKIASAEMQLVKTFEMFVFKKYDDTSAEETALILTTLYRVPNVTVKEIALPDDIKEELRRGHLVIVPAAGRLLGNPYFVPPGPRYHMLVIKGFNDDRGVFITNDPGTRRGNGFQYPQARLFHAIHDWNGGDVLNGAKKMIIIKKS